LFIAELHHNEAAWHALAVEDTAQRLPTDVAQGLSGAEAARRYAQDGPNALPAVKARSGLSILFHQFRSLIVPLLLAAGPGAGRKR
jgi:P-type Ca2+ transporter type 2C